MKLLLDTHVFLWMLERPENINASTLSLIQEPANELLLSAASVWELSIKYAIGKIALPLPPGEYVALRCDRIGVAALPISFEHAAAVAQLPLIHSDPFDRMLVAQALVESLTIVTADLKIEAYAAGTISARR